MNRLPFQWKGCVTVLLLSTLAALSQGAEVTILVPEARTLDALVGETLNHNPELRGMEAQVEATKGLRTQAGLWKNPDLSVMYADRRLQNADTSVNHGFSDLLAITQTFEFPGKATLRKALADQDVVLAEAGLRQFRQALAGRVRLLGYRYALAEQNREAAELVAERSRELIDLLQKRPKAGLQAIFDSGILEGQLAELVATKRALEEEAVLARAELNLLRGWPAGTPLHVMLPGQRPPLPKDLNRFILESMNSSPALQMKRLELQRSRTQLSSSRVEAAPDFAIQPFYSLDSAGDHDQKIGATVTFPLPLWNRNEGNIAAAKANITKAEATGEKAREDLELALLRVYQTRTLIEKQLEQSGEKLLPHLAELADMADRHYRLGAINLQTFLEMQRQYLATMRSMNQAILDDISAALDLQLLAGTIDSGGIAP